MKSRKKLLIILSCIVLVAGVFGYSYFTTVKNILNETPKKKPGERLNIRNELPPVNREDEGVSKFPLEDRVKPSTILVIIKESINTGKTIETRELVPDAVVDLTKEEVEEFYKDYNSVVFDTDKITLVKKYPYLPNCFVVKGDDKFIKVFTTDEEGKAVILDDFPEVPCKNRDDELMRGIEVETLDEVWQLIGDYE